MMLAAPVISPNGVVIQTVDNHLRVLERFDGRGDVGNAMTAGLLYETQLQSNPSNEITVDSLDSDGIGGNVGSGDCFSMRQANVWLKGNFGRVQIGQGSGASDGSAELDLSGTNVIQYSAAGGDLLEQGRVLALIQQLESIDLKVLLLTEPNGRPPAFPTTLSLPGIQGAPQQSNHIAACIIHISQDNSRYIVITYKSQMLRYRMTHKEHKPLYNSTLRRHT